MRQQIYSPADLRDLRASAEQLAKYRKEANELLEVAAVSGDVAAAREPVVQATLKNKELEERREKLGSAGIFLAQYGVEVLNGHTILFVLPAGSSRIEVLQEAQRLVNSRDLVDPVWLKRWSKDERFVSKLAASERICIDGHVNGGDAKDRKTQIDFLRRKGVGPPSREDLAVAFALHWIATGGPLFEWFHNRSGTVKPYTYRVRAAARSLYFSRRGLGAGDIHDDEDDAIIAISARVSSEFNPQK